MISNLQSVWNITNLFKPTNVFFLYQLAGHTTVLILGGGMAGVAAAFTLQSLGMEDFLLLEASERLAGRISNTKFCGTCTLYIAWFFQT